MKECDIVQDLLIGYNDGTLKEGSKEFVDNHLKECESCRKVFNEIKKDDIQEEENIKIDYLKKINKKNSKKNKCIILLIIVVSIIVLINAIIFINYYNTDSGIEIFLEDDISDENFSKLENTIKEYNYEYRYVSKAEALEKFKERLKSENSNILDGYKGENSVFPASFVVTCGWGNGEDLIDSLENVDGIKKITSNTKYNPYLVFCAKFMNYINEKI